MRKHTWTLLTGMMTLMLLPAGLQAEECQSDADCGAGQICLPTPCAVPLPACDPDGGECPEPESECPDTMECQDAWYAECEENSDCPEGWICEEMGMVGCTAPACPEGEECPEPECDEQVYRACVAPPPPSCQSDADCSDGLVCVTYSYSMCSGGRALPACEGPDCPDAYPVPEDESGSCEEVTEGYCVPPYVAPCEVDADCGAGFRCVQEELCSCSAGQADLPAESGSGAREEDGSGDEEPDCSCEPGDGRYCELIETECTADSDCPAGMSCSEIRTPSTGTCTSNPETGETECEEQEGESMLLCLPADYSVWGGGGEPRQGTGDGDYSTNPYDDSLAGSLGAEEVQDQERAEAPAQNDGSDGTGGAREESDSGCSLSALPAAGAGLPSLLLLAGLALLRRLGR